MPQLRLKTLSLPAADLGAENPLPPLSRSPVFAAHVDTPQGPVLRLYEFERVRCVTYQIDFSLPDGSAFLFARVRISNPNDQTIPMYWWSNIAYPEKQGTRVIVPAN